MGAGRGWRWHMRANDARSPVAHTCDCTPSQLCNHRPPCSLSICDNVFGELLPFAVTAATQLRALATDCIHRCGVYGSLELQDWQDLQVGGRNGVLCFMWRCGGACVRAGRVRGPCQPTAAAAAAPHPPAFATTIAAGKAQPPATPEGGWALPCSMPSHIRLGLDAAVARTPAHQIAMHTVTGCLPSTSLATIPLPCNAAAVRRRGR